MHGFTVSFVISNPWAIVSVEGDTMFAWKKLSSILSAGYRPRTSFSWGWFRRISCRRRQCILPVTRDKRGVVFVFRVERYAVPCVKHTSLGGVWTVKAVAEIHNGVTTKQNQLWHWLPFLPRGWTADSHTLPNPDMPQSKAKHWTPLTNLDTSSWA